MSEYQPARWLEESDSSDGLFRPERKRVKRRHSASENSNSGSDCPQHATAPTKESKSSSYHLDGSVTNDRHAKPNRKRRRRSHRASENSRSDSDYRGHTSTVTKRRKRPYYHLEGSANNDRYVKPNRRRRRRPRTFECSRNEAYYQANTSTVTKESRRYACGDSDGNESCFESKRKRRKMRHNVFENSSDDADCPQRTSTVGRERNVQVYRREASYSFSDSDDGRKSRMRRHSSSEYNSSDTDCPMNAGGQRTDRIYQDAEPDEGTVTGHTSPEYSRTERLCRYSVGGIFLETEQERASEYVNTSRQPDATPKIHNGNSVAIPSTSSKSAAHTSVDCPACSICFAKFTTQDIGTTDTCNHSFCATCLKEWSTYISTCPLDRQPFRFILVRHHLKGEIIARIPVHSVRKELSFCGVCGECDRENRLLLCEGCSFACHFTCVDASVNTMDYRQWICPFCFSLNEIIQV